MKNNYVRTLCVLILLNLYSSLKSETEMAHEIPAVGIFQHAQLLKEIKTRHKLKSKPKAFITTATAVKTSAMTMPGLTMNASSSSPDLQKTSLTVQTTNTTHVHTPTTAYLSIPDLKTNAYTIFGIDYHPERKAIVEKVISREKEHDAQYYPFYHGQKFEFRLLQDTVKTLLELVQLRDSIKSFAFLRLPHEKKFTPVAANAFLNQLKATYGLAWNDMQHGLQERLLSVNLSLFGSTSHICSGECTFNFFLYSTSYLAPAIKELLQNFFNHYAFSTDSFINQLVALYEKYRTSEGNLLQIFIPKNKVDECAYLSHAYGKPYEDAIVKDCFDKKLKRHIRIAPILEKYKTNPQSIPHLDSLQARLVMCSDTFLNPDSGIKIFRYTTMSKDIKKQYKAELKAIVQQVLIDYIEKQKLLFTKQPQKGLAQCENRPLCTLVKLIALPQWAKLTNDAPKKAAKILPKKAPVSKPAGFKPTPKSTKPTKATKPLSKSTYVPKAKIPASTSKAYYPKKIAATAA